MQRLTIRITALAPLAFPSRKPGTQFRASLPYVPGAAIYGALGMRYSKQKPFDIELFQQIRCHNAYPSMSTDLWVRPLPATAIHPKGAKKSIIDSLVERVCWEQQQPAALIYAPTDTDGRPWEAAEPGFYTLHGRQRSVRSVQQRVLTRVAINRSRGTAEDGRLYSPLAISEMTEDEITKTRLPTQFHGSLIFPDGRQAELEAALKEITHLGARQTSGLGAVQIESALDSRTIDEAQKIFDRIDAMTKLFKAQTTLYHDLGGKSCEIAERTIFTVNLLADAILLDQGWLPTIELSEAMLEEWTGVKARLVRAFTNSSIVTGWNVSWQRPKPNNVAVIMGSLFVFQADAPLDVRSCERLAQLQLDGIGERRAEGYGQVRICDNFHVPEVEE